MRDVLIRRRSDNPPQDNDRVREVARLHQCGRIAGSKIDVVRFGLKRAVIVVLRFQRIDPAIRLTQARKQICVPGIAPE